MIFDKHVARLNSFISLYKTMNEQLRSNAFRNEIYELY
jgi:hypothetical protein